VEVKRGEDVEQRRVELAAEQDLDLGDVLLQHNGTLDLLVVDEAGDPVSAYVEIGPFAAGKRVDELYPPMLHLRSDQRGRCKLPVPSARSIVRARVQVGTSRGQPADGPRSANLLLDPALLPPRPWRIVLVEPVRTSFEVGSPDVTALKVQDELGIVDTWPAVDEKGHAACDLVPGQHRVCYVDAAGRVRDEQEFTVAKDHATVRGP
jgi:hypothetical protein